MYLSEITLNLFNRNSMRVLADIYKTHQFVMAGFVAYGSQEHRVLYRVEHEIRNEAAVARILVQSSLRPDWAGREEETLRIQTKEFNPDLPVGARYKFRLQVNPIVTRNGKRSGLIRDEALCEWLKKRENVIGAVFQSFVAVDEGYSTGKKSENGRDHKISIKKARFEGSLKVADPDILREAVTKGIGPAKAFGCGLLSLLRSG